MSEWRTAAACRDEDPAIFFPGRGEVAKEVKARAICARCPVAAECLAAALAVPGEHDFGLWGGRSQRERRILRGQMGKAGAVRSG